MSGYVLSRAAVADLRGIWKSGEAQWGADQADRYAHRLRLGMETIASDPRRGVPSVRPGYRRFAVGAHMLFFRPHTTGIEVVRILHQRMDFDRHL